MPLGIGSILNDTFSYFFKKALKAIGFSIIFNILIMIVFVVGLGASFLPLLMGDQSTLDPATFFGTGFILSFIVIGLIATVIYAVLNAFLIQLAYDTRIGAPTEIGRYFSTAFRNIVPIIVNMIAVVAVLMVSSIPVVMFFLIHPLFGLIAGLPILSWVVACVSMVIPAILYDNAGFGAIARSFRLTEDYRWPMVGVSILFFIIIIIASIIIGIPTSFLGNGVAGIVQMILNATTGGLMAFFTAMIFARLKEIKDGVTPHDMVEIFR
ncbi:MAG: hypothetical protein ACPGGK_13570 [Pikeienuella sp.]